MIVNIKFQYICGLWGMKLVLKLCKTPKYHIHYCRRLTIILLCKAIFDLQLNDIFYKCLKNYEFVLILENLETSGYVLVNFPKWQSWSSLVTVLYVIKIREQRKKQVSLWYKTGGFYLDGEKINIMQY